MLIIGVSCLVLVDVAFFECDHHFIDQFRFEVESIEEEIRIVFWPLFNTAIVLSRKELSAAS